MSLSAIMRVSIFFFFTATLAAAVHADTEDAFYRSKNNGTLTVGYVILAPWVQKDPRNGTLSGAYIDLIEEIARQSSLKLTYVETTWPTFPASLANGTFDVSIVPSYITIQRANAISFTNPISYLGNTAIVRSTDDRFKSVYDLNKAGIKVSVMQGEQGHDFARVSLPHAEISALATGDQNLIYTDVLTGRSDAALGDIGSISSFLTRNPGLKDIAPGAPYSILPVSWAVRYPDQAMRSFLNSSIEYLHGNGIIAAVHKKWKVPGETRP